MIIGHSVSRNPENQASLTRLLTCVRPVTMLVLMLLTSALVAQAQPVITAIDPPSRVAYSGTFSLTITGTGFLEDARVEFEGVLLTPAATPTPTSITVQVPAELIDVPVFNGVTLSVRVENPSAPFEPVDLRFSNIVQMDINAPPPPAISSLSPNEASAGAPDLVLTVNGSNFINRPGTVVLFGATPLTPSSITPAAITVTVPAAQLAVAGGVDVRVRNVDEQLSDAVPFTINPAPSPTLTSLDPPEVQEGSPDTLLTVTGSNFQDGAVIVFNGDDLVPTAFGSSTSLSATIPAAQLATAGTRSVVVRNPDALTSGSLTFTVTAAPQPPVISQVNPNSVDAGSGELPITVTGTGFQSGATVRFGTTDLMTGFISETSLSATIPAMLLEDAGQFNITVRNPDDQVSDPSTFTVNAVIPVPTLSQIDPNTAVAGSGDLELNVTGGDFIAAPDPGASVVRFGSLPLATTFVSSTSLSALIPASALESAANVTVTVRNGEDVSRTSDGLLFTITAAPGQLTITPNPATPPAGNRGASYAGITFTAAGGTPDYSFALTEVSGTLASLGLAFTPSATSASIGGTPTAAGSVTFRVRVTDNADPTPATADTAELTITIANPPLEITTSATLPSASLNQAYTAPLAATGGDGQNYNWSVAVGSSLPPGLGLDPASGATISLTGTPTQADTFTFTLQVDDNDPQTTAATRAFTLVVGSLPAPTISQLAPSTETAGSGDTPLTVTGTNFVDGAVIRFGDTALTTNFGSETSLTATIPAALLATAGSVNVTVRNPDNQTSAPSVFTITEPTPALTITTTSDLGTATRNVAFQVQLTATGGSPDPQAGQPVYAWQVVSGSTLPAGLSLNPTTGLLSGTPTQLGNFSFTVRVTDSLQPPQQSSDEQLFTLEVQQFTITTSSLPDGRVGVAYNHPLAFTGGPTTNPADYQWQLAPGSGPLPGGLSLNPVTGRITGTPEPISGTVEIFNFQVFLRHEPTGAQTANRALSIAVSGGGLDITVSELPVGTIGQPYGPNGNGITFQAVNGTSPYTIDFSPTTITLLQGLGFQLDRPNATNPATIVNLRMSGSPTAAGSFPVEVIVRDGVGTQVERQLNLMIVESALTMSPTTLPSVAVNQPFQQALSLGGLTQVEQNPPPGQPSVNWQLLGIVPGLSLSSAGVLSGTFTDPGQFPFSVRATTSLREITQEYVLVVTLPRPEILTTSLPNAIIGSPYTAEIQASGGSPGYTWNVGAIVLPSGLTFEAASVTTPTLRISGTPLPGAETRTFSLVVTDAANQTATRDFTLAVTSMPVPPLTLLPFENPQPAEQKTVTLNLAQPFPLQLNGTATLSFTPDATVNADDPAVRFLVGGRSAVFFFPPNSTEAVFPNANPQRVQTGTVAGTVRVQASIENEPAVAAQEFTIPRTAPVILEGLSLQSTANGFNVILTGYSTPRDLSNARVTFTATAGTNLATTELNIPLTAAATAWFESDDGRQNGSSFRLTIPFTIEGGSNVVQSVSVTLSNSVGNSNTRTASF